ncbi:MAG: shikimate dehydrogenase [Clostridia bacterium]|nr:shikimate dehydrogenase [Clostridia bacterium]
MAWPLAPSGGRPALTFAVLGWPVGHSLSPLLHGAAFAAAGSPHRYLALAVPPGDLPRFCARLRDEPGWGGANVTIPHKEGALALADEAEPAARAIGAANVLTPEGGRLHAANTDGPALVDCLRQRLYRAPELAVVLGAGGGARAAVWALGRLGCETVAVVARRPEAAEALLTAAPGLAGRARLRPVSLADRASVRALLRDASLIVNATPVGLADPSESPLPEDVWPDGPGRGRGLVLDLVYGPRRPRLGILAEQFGFTYVDGLPMLVRQAALSWSVWFGRPADESVMWAAVSARTGGAP